MPTQDTRNYNTISPSARSLLLLKGHTTIPYARQAAALIQYPGPYEPDFSNRYPGFWIRVMHFEARYQSINALIPSDAVNILEISSGFSFRGLALATERPVNYVDTDLPDVIATKQKMIDALMAATPAPASGQPPAPANGQLPAPANGQPAAPANGQLAASNNGEPTLRGHYELRSLNALDTAAFQAIVDSMPPGPIRTSQGVVPRPGSFDPFASLVIVNEGLLMYLGKEEKRQLCQFISKVLRERGGYWITADIYIRRSMPDDPELEQGDTLKEFLKQHKVQENMFESFEEATQLFADAGLVLDKEAEPDYANLSAAPHFMASASPELLGRLRGGGKIHATWRLRPA